MHQLAKEYSQYQEITVYETNQLYGKTGKYRFMQFSEHAVQGAMDMKDPKRIVLEYPRAKLNWNRDISSYKLKIGLQEP